MSGLRRKTLLTRGTAQLKRTPLKRGTAILARTALKRSGSKPMKSRGPKMTPIRSSARGQECTLRFPGVCNYDPATTVLCHENGAGMGMKSPDEAGAYGCYACHMVLDGQHPRSADFSRELMLALFKEAQAQTRRILKRKGLLGQIEAQKNETALDCEPGAASHHISKEGNND